MIRPRRTGCRPWAGSSTPAAPSSKAVRIYRRSTDEFLDRMAWLPPLLPELDDRLRDLDGNMRPLHDS